MSKIDVEYHNLLDKILQEGYTYEDPNRKGISRIEIPSYTFRHEFKDGFPAISTKKLHYKNVVTELLWFLRGDTNIKYLVDNGCNIWNKDAYNYYCKKCKEQEFMHNSFEAFIDMIKGIEDSKLSKRIPNNYKLGDLGPVYGAQWREIYDKNDDDILRYDQIKTLINTLKNNPLGTQHIINAWNVLELDDMALQPCHYGFQIVMKYYYEPGLRHIADVGNLKGWKLGFELHWNQRSVDTFLGLPYNIASYATLALILEKITGHKALGIQGDLKKVHLYDNSLDAVKEQLSRDVDKYKAPDFDAPILDEIKFTNIDEYVNKLLPIDFTIENYESYPHIKVEMLERNK